MERNYFTAVETAGAYHLPTQENSHYKTLICRGIYTDTRFLCRVQATLMDAATQPTNRLQLEVTSLDSSVPYSRSLLVHTNKENFYDAGSLEFRGVTMPTEHCQPGTTVTRVFASNAETFYLQPVVILPPDPRTGRFETRLKRVTNIENDVIEIAAKGEDIAVSDLGEIKSENYNRAHFMCSADGKVLSYETH
jgi:hypothetical protein